MAKPTRPSDTQDLEPVVVTGVPELERAPQEPDGEELVRVEAISDGTYPDLVDPRREPWYALYRTGRIFDGNTNRMAPGEVFLMKRKDAMTAVKEPGNAFGWVHILKENELVAADMVGEIPVPSTTAPRGYGQGRRPGSPRG